MSNDDKVTDAPRLEAAFRDAQLALFRSSVLKQAKWRALETAIGPVRGIDALDLGSDNGVISWLLRRSGGRWSSADLTEATVAAIRAMVGDRVRQVDGRTLPYADASFDLVVVVDMLEHVEDDRLLLQEIGRCLRPGGRAVLNLPHRKRFALLPMLRNSLGLTDAWHGHRRSGYTAAELAALLPARLRLVRQRSYSRFFSHLLDTILNWAYLRKTRGRGERTAKGTVVTGGSLGAADVRAMHLAYPAMRAFAALDHLVPWTRGYMLVAHLEKLPASTVP